VKLKLVILILIVLFSFAVPIDYVFAHEGHEHAMANGTMKDDDRTAGQTASNPAQAIEVGNKICPVSGDKVGEMGEVIKYEHNGKMYNLCCKTCIKDFKKDPEKYSKIAEEEAAKEKQGTGEHKENNDDHGHDHSGHQHE